MEKDEGKEKAKTVKEGVLLNEGAKQDDSKLIEEAFGESIEYEEISEIGASPINEPVKLGEVSEGFVSKENTAPKQEQIPSDAEEDLPQSMLEDYDDYRPPTDAPEQVINEQENFEQDGHNAPMASPIDDATEHAGLMADSFLGVADQLLEIGGGFFVKIKKKKSFIYFDELIERSEIDNFPKINQEIDEINKKNITRIKLDDSDRALLKPLLIQVLKNQTKQLTPEQQLAAASISTVIKKGQNIMALRKEMKLYEQNLEDRIEKHLEKFEELVKRNESFQKVRVEREKEGGIEENGKENTTQGKAA